GGRCRAAGRRADPRESRRRGTPRPRLRSLRSTLRIVPGRSLRENQGGSQMNRTVVRAGIVTLALLASALTAAAGPADWSSVDAVFGTTGKDQPGEVRRYGWPRTDLHVQVNGVPVEPALALGGWAAFKMVGSSGAVTMGDLVLLGPEVNPVVRQLQAGGFEI